MKFEVLKRSHVKRNIMIGAFLIAIISAVVLNYTRAKYRVTDTVPLINGEVNYKVPDLNMVSLYVANGNGYEEADVIPSSGYVLNKEQSFCGQSNNGEIVKDDTVSIVYENGSVSVNNITKKGTKCYLYFDTEEETSGESILINYPTILTRSDFSTTVTETTKGTIYYTVTSKGRTYYFAGNPTDNWVQFGGFYWRIIRINENGTIRMIYSGNEETGPAITGINTQIQNSPFNTNHDDNVYVGYMYTINELHGVSTSSIVKKVLDTWYQNNLANYTDEIDLSTGFCGDRTAYTNSTGTTSGGGLGITSTYYGAYIRLITNKSPTFECLDEDLYTTSESENGNKALDYPI